MYFITTFKNYSCQNVLQSISSIQIFFFIFYTTINMKSESTVEIEGMEVTVEGDKNSKFLPAYPEGLLDVDTTRDPKPYEGKTDDLEERMRYKLYQVWSTWSTIRLDEPLIKALMYNEKDTEEVKKIKAWFILTIDRIGKILADTNITEEIKGKTL